MKNNEIIKYTVGEPYDKVMPEDGAIFETHGKVCICSVGLTDISEKEIQIVENGTMRIDLCYIDGVIFLCASFGNGMSLAMPFNMSLYQSIRLDPPLDEGYLVSIILVENRTNIIKAIRVIRLDNEFSKKLYELSLRQWNHKITDYDKRFSAILESYTDESMLAFSVAHMKFFGDYSMKYTKKQMIERYNQNEALDYLFFWGHTENTSEITKACLSQWYDCTFAIDNITFYTAEQYMMAQKAVLFEDGETVRAIMSVRDPKHHKALGRRVKGFDNVLWDKKKYKIVLDGNILKFSQNKDLKEFLLSTGDKILVEASPYDKVWGIGMSADSPDAENPSKWKGENLLGFALMEARDILRNKDVTIW